MTTGTKTNAAKPKNYTMAEMADEAGVREWSNKLLGNYIGTIGQFVCPALPKTMGHHVPFVENQRRFLQQHVYRQGKSTS